MVLTGIALGVGSALAIYLLFEKLRAKWLNPVAFIGWIIVAIVLFYAFAGIFVYFSLRIHPVANTGPLDIGSAGAGIALVLGALLLICGGLGRSHRRRFRISWMQAFGFVMAEAATAVLGGFAFNEYKYDFAATIRRDNADLDAIQASYDGVRTMLGMLDLSLLVSLLMLLFFAGYKTKFGPKRDAEAAEGSSATA